jgi:hypothetical protein
MCCSSNKVICMMSKLANNVLNVTLNIKCPKMAHYDGFRNSLYFPAAECDKIEREWDHHKFSEERSSGKRKPCNHLENSSTSSAEICISSSPAASENLPVFLCKLKLIIFNTFSKIQLELFFGSFVGVVGTILYCNLKRKVL